jgi:hypothetical protein
LLFYAILNQGRFSGLDEEDLKADRYLTQALE